MAGGRRSVNRTIAPRSSNLDARSKPCVSGSTEHPSISASRVTSSSSLGGHLPHVAMPETTSPAVSSSSTWFRRNAAADDVVFETMMTIFACLSLFVQYLNLYRTVWWLPHSHVNYAMNIYLIDGDVSAFVVVLFSRRLVWALVKCAVLALSPRKLANFAYVAFRCLTVALVATVLLWLSYRIFLRHHVLYLLYLHYLLLVHVTLFGSAAEPFLALVPDYTRFCVAGSPGVRPIYHVCSADAQLVRDEVAHMKTDFNYRIKQALFTSIQLAYYTAVVPLFFAQSWVLYEWRWCMLHALCVCVCCWSLCACHSMSSVYCDTLHRAALHLGSWRHLDNRRTHLALSQWSRDQICSFGVLVRHCRNFYRCSSLIAAAEPGNVHHQRFYFWFGNPCVLMCVLLAVHSACVCVLLACVCVSGEWQRILGSVLVLLFSLPPLYSLSRHALVAATVYRVEHKQLQHLMLCRTAHCVPSH